MAADLQQLGILQELPGQHEVDHHASARDDLPELWVELPYEASESLEKGAKRSRNPWELIPRFCRFLKKYD